VVGCYLPAGVDGPDTEWLEQPDDRTAPPDWEERPWDGGLIDTAYRLVAETPGRLEADLAFHAAGRDGADSMPEGVWKLGDHPVMLGSDVTLEPGVVLDVRRGAIRLADSVEVRAGCRLEGPLSVGRETVLLGGAIGTSSLGPVCRLRGEIEESTILGYANKAHDGFLGHAYLGRWVNLGALTTNSDLKNSYGAIRLGGPDGPIETGLTKLGCLLGDHVKTAIGTRLNTGSVVGAGSNLFGDSLPPTWVPPFSWGSDPGSSLYERDRFLDVAGRVLPRRGVEFDERTAAWLAACWEAAGRAEGA
jgi:UDP-N-acetylglucosamine diphosphorylase/glucosamine-1-phosphate N-acetyltransferase